MTVDARRATDRARRRTRKYVEHPGRAHRSRRGHIGRRTRRLVRNAGWLTAYLRAAATGTLAQPACGQSSSDRHVARCLCDALERCRWSHDTTPVNAILFESLPFPRAPSGSPRLAVLSRLRAGALPGFDLNCILLPYSSSRSCSGRTQQWIMTIELTYIGNRPWLAP